MDTGPALYFLTNILKYRLDRQLRRLGPVAMMIGGKAKLIAKYHVISVASNEERTCCMG